MKKTIEEILEEIAEHREGKWGIVFLSTQGRLPIEEKEAIMRNAIVMHYERVKECPVRTKSAEGYIQAGEYGAFGVFAGQQFHAEVEGKRGKVKLKFLVSDQSYRRNSYGRLRASMN